MTKYLQFDGETLERMTAPAPEPKPILVRLLDLVKSKTVSFG